MRCGYAKTHGCVGGAAGRAHCAEHRVGANPTMNTMNTGNTIDGQWHTVSHVLRKFHGTWLTHFPVLSPVFLVFPVFPVGLAHSIGSAQCALPANRTRSQVLRKFHSAWHTLRHVLPSPYTSVHLRTHPYTSAHTMCSAHSAEQANLPLYRSSPQFQEQRICL